MNLPEIVQGLRAALASEAKWQAAEFKRRESLTPADQVALGHAWPPLRVVGEQPARRGAVALELRSESSPLHTGIGPGDPVDLDGTVGLVLSVDSRRVWVRVDESVPSGRTVRVAKRHDGTTFQRYQDALATVLAQPNHLCKVLAGDEDPRESVASCTWEGLNAAQELAATQVVRAEDLALVHGPPGTGKTRTLIAVAKDLVRRGESPWLSADSNAAVDHLAVSAAAAGLRVVRLGHPARIGSAAERLGLDWQMDHGDFAQAFRALDKEMAKARGDWRTLRTLRKERRRLEEQARDVVLSRAQVVCATLATFAGRHGLRARIALVDEATQAIEPAIWSMAAQVEKLALFGDPRQLGPVVMEPGNPLQRSALERLADDHPLTMLEVQHRMDARIQRLVQDVYGAAYRPHPSVANHGMTLPWAGAVGVIDTAGSGAFDERDPVTGSTFNRLEMRLVCTLVDELRRAGVAPERIGVLAPYSAQVGRLADLAALQECEVATINAFQGREKDVMIISWTRSNEDGELGFVRDPRRAVVAATRARQLLVFIGDSATLTRDARLAAMWDRAAEGGMASIWDPPWDTAMDG